MTAPKLFYSAEDALCYLTECAFATVQDLEIRSRVSKSQISRARSIAEIGLANCQMYVKPQQAQLIHCPRVAKRLESAAKSDPGSEGIQGGSETTGKL